ncbi:MAG: xylulokinase [Armatimonadetes bacterium]|nr:xylulokinase [Armatimonadota bacterium]
MPYLLGVDVGTTGAKTILVDHKGKLVARVTVEYPLYSPQPGWSEQEPEDWWQATVASIRGVLTESGVKADRIAGVGLSGQMHGSVFLDAAGKVIRRALLWNDQRTAEQCAWITQQVGRKVVQAETCNPVLTGFQAPKIIWLRDHEPANYERIAQVLLPKDYVRYRLTGEYATEVSDASGTALFNVPQRCWSEAMLNKLDLPREWFPRVYESPEVTGEITAEVAALTGLRAGTPVVGGGGDQAAGGVGNGIVEPGAVSCTTGTSGVVFAYLDEPAMDAELRTHTFCHAVPGKWHVMGVMLAAGGSLRWLRDTLFAAEMAVAEEMGVDPYELMTAEAAAAPVGSEGLIFLPYLTGERTPYPDPNARGVFFGLSLRHTKRHLARAVLEGVAYGLRDSFELIAELGVEMPQVRASGGGARSKLWRQIQADVCRREMSVINVDEGAAFGAALLAGVGAGVYADVVAACRQTIKVVNTLAPQPDAAAEYEEYYQLFRRLYAHLARDFVQLGGLVHH